MYCASTAIPSPYGDRGSGNVRRTSANLPFRGLPIPGQHLGTPLPIGSAKSPSFCDECRTHQVTLNHNDDYQDGRWYGEEVLQSAPRIHFMNGLSVPKDEVTRERVQDALRSTDDHNETEFLNALLKIIEYERDETFNSSELI